MARIYIDPGHDGAVDPGAVGQGGTQEAVITLAIAQLLGELLVADGHQVGFSRSGPRAENYELWPITQGSNDFAADVFVSIHCNAAVSPAAHGTETLYHPNSPAGQALAEAIQAMLVAAIGLTDRGVKDRAELYVLRATAAPAALVEVAFISNPEEEMRLADPYFQQAVAGGIRAGIDQFLGA